MSAFQFGVRDVVLSPSDVKRHKAIAKEHGCEFIYQGRTTGTPTTGWFSAQNRGEPFDSNLARSVRRALIEAGLAPAGSRGAA